MEWVVYAMVAMVVVSWIVQWAKIDALKADLARELAWSKALLEQRDEAVNTLFRERCGKDGAK